MGTCDRGCLEAIQETGGFVPKNEQEKSTFSTIQQFIESERKKAEQLLLTTKDQGSVKCPPSWTDVTVNGKTMCQAFNRYYGSCPPGYTSFGAKCLPIDNVEPAKGEPFIFDPKTISALLIDNTRQDGFEVKNGMRVPKYVPNVRYEKSGEPVELETANTMAGTGQMAGIISYS